MEQKPSPVVSFQGIPKTGSFSRHPLPIIAARELVVSIGGLAPRRVCWREPLNLLFELRGCNWGVCHLFFAPFMPLLGQLGY